MKNSAVSPLQATVIIAVTLLAVGLWIYRSTAPPLVSTTRTSQKVASENFLRQKAMESGGDINRLSVDDQKQVNDITGGQGANTLRSMAPPRGSVSNATPGAAP
jgi:hypothetical protein